MSFTTNPSQYEGCLIKETDDLRLLVKELLAFINRNGLDFDTEDEIRKLLIKTGL